MLKKSTSVSLIIQVFLLLFCFTGSFLQAEEPKPTGGSKNLSLRGVKKIFLHVQNSQLKLSQFSVKKNKIQIFSNFSSLLDKVIVKKRKKGTSLHIWIFKNAFNEGRKNINKAKHIGEVLVKMPALPVVLTQDLGSTSVEFWKSSLVINKWNGSIQVKKTQANLSIFSKKVDVDIDSYTGRLKIESYSNKLKINDSQGAFYLNVFSGSVSLKKIKANVKVTTYNGSVIAEDMENKLVIEAEKSVIKLKNIKATTKVKIVKGEVKVGNIGAISLNIISSGSASINVSLNKRAAKLSLWSQRFKIKVPAGLKRKSLGRGEEVKGFLQGVKPRAFVVLKNKEGRIRLKL